jgi:predicted DNA-binding protein (MmcQ/YjbR family)
MLSVESLREQCRSKPGSQETFPFDLRTLVFKVAGKMYALCDIDGDPLELSLKCDPDEAEALRSVYPAVKPGYHLNKRHWNTVTLDGTVGDKVVLEWLDRSYDRVVAGLTRREREALAHQEGEAG